MMTSIHSTTRKVVITKDDTDTSPISTISLPMTKDSSNVFTTGGGPRGLPPPPL